MKSAFFTLLVLCLLNTLAGAQGQLYIPNGSTVFTNGASIITLDNAKLTNNGTFAAGGTLQLTGSASNANSALEGTGTTTLNNLKVNKSSNNARVSQNITVTGNLTLTSGGLELFAGNVDLGTTGQIVNETETNRVFGSGGTIQATATLNAPSAVKPGNLGAEITSAQNLGITTIKRGNQQYSATGNSILRNFLITPATNAGLNATLRFYYLDAEINGNNEGIITMWRSTNNGSSWTAQSGTYTRDGLANWVQLPGINAFSTWTLADPGALILSGCPSFSAAPANAGITNSTCTANCTPSGGTIAAPAGTPCPVGSTLQYQLDGGVWTTNLPVYAQTGPAQTVKTRCSCDMDPSMNSAESAPVTTVPGTCTTPTASASPGNQTLCNGLGTTAEMFTSNVPGATFTWTNSNAGIGLGASGSGSSIASFTAMNAGSAPVSGTITVTPQANGCTGSTTSFTITVNPTPNITVTPTSQTVCNNANTVTEVFTSNVAGTTYTWTNNNASIGIGASGSGSAIPSFTATNTGSAPIAGTFTVTPQANSCPGASAPFTITVNPTPNITVTPTSQTVCNNANTVTEVFTSNVAGTTYAWTNNNASIGIGASGSGSSISSFTAMNTGSAPIAGTFTVTPQANSCVGPSAPFTITVNPTPNITVTPTSQTVCNNANTAMEVFTANVAGTTYTWTNNNAMIGIGASGSGSAVASFAATNSGSSPIAGTFTVTPQANSCVGPSAPFTITVNPTPTVNVVSSQVICNGAMSTTVTFSGGVSGTVFGWTNSNPAVGLPASGAGNIVPFAATNAGSALIVATITVTPTDAGGICTGSPINFQITVNPTPTVIVPANQVLPDGATAGPYNFTGNVPGSVFSWTNSNTSVGWNLASGSGNIPTFMATNPGPAQIVATFTVTPNYTNAGVTCQGTPQSFTLTVGQLPTVDPVANQSLCAGAATSAITFSGTLPGTVFNWTNSDPSIGLAATGSGNISSFNAINNGSAPVVATITVTPSLTIGNVTSMGIPRTFSITVNPKPTVTVPLTQVICKGNTAGPLNFASIPPGGTFTWTNSNPSIGLGASGSGNIPSFIAGVPGVGLITVTPTANGCAGAPVVFLIIVI